MLGLAWTRSAALQRSDRQIAQRANRSMVESLEMRSLFSIKGMPFAQVAPGFELGAMVADPKRNVVYVLDETNDKVLAVDTDLGRTVASASVGGEPTSLAVGIGGTELFVSSQTGNVVDVYSLPDLKFTRALSITNPVGLAAGTGARLYVGGGTSYSGRQLDSQTGKILATFDGPFGRPQFVTNAAGTVLYSSSLGLSTTSTDSFDISNPNVAPMSAEGYDTDMENGKDVALDEQYGRLYAMSGGVYGVNVVDLKANATKYWAFSDEAAYGTSVTLAGAYVYAASGDPYDGGIFEYDRASGSPVDHFVPDGDYAAASAVRATNNGRVMYATEAVYNDGVSDLGLIGSSSLVVNNVPTARFTATTPSNGSVTFDASTSAPYLSSQTLKSYTWDFGDGTTGTGAVVKHIYAKAGTFAPKLTVLSSTGLTDDYSTSVTIAAVTGGTTSTPLTGTPIGTGGSFLNGGNTIAKAFDGSLATFFDGPTANGDTLGLDLGSAKVLTQIKYAPRSGYASRMVGGVFQGSNSATFATATTLMTITAAPVAGSFTTVTIANASAYRYVRYVAPNGSFGDVAELQFLGAAGAPTPPATTPKKLAGTTIGTAGSFGNAGNTIAKVFDGNVSTFFDGPTANGNWVGLDLGTAQVIAQIGYSPRSGFASRMVGGVFQGSNNADFSNASTLLTITQAPANGVLPVAAVTNATAYRYVRYLAPAGSYGDIAEIGFYG